MKIRALRDFLTGKTACAPGDVVDVTEQEAGRLVGKGSAVHASPTDEVTPPAGPPKAAK